MNKIVKKLKSLEQEGRVSIFVGARNSFLGKEVTVDSMGIFAHFDKGALKVLEEAQEKGLLSQLSPYRFSGSEGPLFRNDLEHRKRKERFLKFFSKMI